MTLTETKQLISRQCEAWPLCRDNFAALDRLITKTICDEQGRTLGRVMFNPARIASSTAKTADPQSIAARKCFLCRENRPAEQFVIAEGDYEILVNPFPIFPVHLTIASRTHKPQLLINEIRKMLRFAELMEDLTVFYNGAKCGASAPDHHHFQAANFEIPENLTPSESGSPALMTGRLICGAEIVSADTDLIESTVRNWIEQPDGSERPVNVLCRRLTDGRYRVVDYPRKRHRPECYGQLLISPASVEMAGYIVAPRHEDFMAADLNLTRQIIKEVTFSEKEIKELWNL